ncbi:hypothetical protein [Thalassolituus marinus]|uniref:Transcriptional regulator SutA RNAP-binding domain-containing protein n=1 Tax=Thalassolituus marinus TaxID=671053 RepID=A0ABS7ZVK8_9GAMM|nr:hypothetical protein [Thalassolituus marinus]MCA6064620.1 hypothetical protein [Thalassolituus marinus]
MKKRPTKRDLRDQLDQEVAAFLQQGGEVKTVERGTSALINGRFIDHSLPFEKPREERTPVSDVLKTIDQRKSTKRQSAKSTTPKKSSRPRKKIIYDDFGEPLRVIWEED